MPAIPKPAGLTGLPEVVGGLAEAALPYTRPGEVFARPEHVFETSDELDFGGETPANAPAAVEELDFGDEAPAGTPETSQIESQVTPSMADRLAPVNPFSYESLGGFEVLAMMATGLPAALAGIAGGTVGALGKQDPKAFKEGMKAAAAPFEGIIFQPRSETGKIYAQGLGRVFHAYSEGVDWLADKMPEGLFIMDQPGAPGVSEEGAGKPLGAAVKVAGELAPFLLPIPGGKAKVKPKPAAEVPPAPIRDHSETANPLADPANVPLGRAPAATEYFGKEAATPEAAVVPGVKAPPEAAAPAPVEGAPPAQLTLAERVTRERELERMNIESRGEIAGQAAEGKAMGETWLKTNDEAAMRLAGMEAKAKAKAEYIAAETARITAARAKGDIPTVEVMALQDAGLPLPGRTTVDRPTGKLDLEHGPASESVAPVIDIATQRLAVAAEDGIKAEAAAGAAANVLKAQEKGVPGEAIAKFLTEEEGLFGPKPPRPPGAGVVEEVSVAGLAREAAATAKGRKMRPWDLIQSPGMVARRVKPLVRYVQAGVAAKRVQSRINSMFNRRMTEVERMLSPVRQRLLTGGQALRDAKGQMNDLLVQGDLAARDFTLSEMLANGVSRNVADGYLMTRAALKHAHGMMSRHRAKYGLETGKREGYIPHYFHEYIVKVGDNTYSYKSLSEARTVADALTLAGQNALIHPKMARWEGLHQQAASIGDAAYFRLRNNVEDVFSMSRDDATQLLKDVAAPRAKGRSLGNLMQRKGASGWEQNMDHVLRNYFNNVGRYIALDPFKRQSLKAFEKEFGAFGNEHAGLAKYIKNYINDVNGVPASLDSFINQALLSNRTLGPIIEEYLGANAIQQIAHSTTKATAVLKLGLFNVSSALVNGSQLLLANGVLGPKWLGQGLVATAKPSAADLGILRQLNVERSGQKFFAETVQGSPAMGKISRGFDKSMVLFAESEYRLRSATVLGAYRRARGEGYNHKEALRYADEVNERVNFNYGTEAAPDLFRRTGSLGAIALQFKKYPIKSFEFVRTLEGAEHARFWVPYFAASGLTGVPFGSALSKLSETVTGVNPELEVKSQGMKWAGDDPEKKALMETMLYGVPSQAGVDISARVRLGDIIPHRGTDLLGPTFGSAFRATQMAANESWGEALRAISPAPGNALQAVINDGIIRAPWDRDRIVAELTPAGRVIRGVGFSPIEETKAREVERILAYEGKRVSEKKRTAVTAYVRAVEAEDDDAADAALDAAIDLGVTKRTIKEALKVRGATRGETRAKRMPKAQREDILPLLDFLE